MHVDHSRARFAVVPAAERHRELLASFTCVPRSNTTFSNRPKARPQPKVWQTEVQEYVRTELQYIPLDHPQYMAVAERGGDLLGVVSWEMAIEGAFIQCVASSTTCRRQGVASALIDFTLDECEQFMVDHGLRTLDVFTKVHCDNEPSLRMVNVGGWQTLTTDGSYGLWKLVLPRPPV